MIEKLQTTKDINDYFANWSDLTEGDRLEAIRSLKKTGMLTAVRTKPDKSFRCPINSFHLARPCGLTDCQFNLTNGPSKNCLVNAIGIAKNNRLSANETAEIMNLQVSDINSHSGTAITKIRKTLIKDRLDNFKTPRFKYIAGHCVNCETYIQDDMDMGMSSEMLIDQSHGWCSSDCRKAKPKWQFELEVEFGCHYLDILSAAISVYKPEVVDQLFSIPTGYTGSIKKQLYDRMDRLSQ